MDKTAFPLGGAGFHFLSHFYGVHHNLSVEITRGKLPTLYKPKSPRSRSTLRALTLGPVVISPATCSRIFTISSGLVKMTWEPPACRQGRREKQISKSEPDWQCNKKKSRKASKSYHFTSPSSPGNKRTALWPVHRDGPKLLKLVCTWNVRCFSDQSFQSQPSYIQNGKTNTHLNPKVKPDVAVGSSDERERDALCLLWTGAKICIYNSFFPHLSNHSLCLAQPPASTSLGCRTNNTT